jgi:hypothetical protein
MSDKLIVIEQKEVAFYEDSLMAVRGEDGQIYVAVGQMCRALGLNERSQRRKIQNHGILSEGYTRGDISTPPSADGRGGGLQRSVLIRVDLIPLWLSGIELGKVSEEMRPKMERFQRESAKVLWEAFQNGRLTADLAFEELLQSDSPAAQAYKMLQAMMQLARNQVLLESKLLEHDATLETHGQRIEELEASIGNEDRYISREQASRVSQAVRGIGLLLTKQSGSSEYGRVYGELYRKFEISAYRELPASKYDEAMKWLNEWRQSLVDDVEF